MARVEGRQQIERLDAPNLPDHDPVGPHAQGVAQQVADRDLAATLDGRGPALEPDHVRLAQPELRGVLDRHHPLGRVDPGREGVQQRRLAGSGSARDEDAPPLTHRGRQQVAELDRERSRADQLLRSWARGREAAHRKRRPIDGERRDDDIDARPVGQPRVDHRAELVDPAADGGENSLDRVAERLLGGEANGGLFDSAEPLDIDRVRPVHHHLLDLGIGEKLLERPETDRIAQDQVADLRSARPREHRGGLVDQFGHRRLDATTLDAARRLGAPALDQPQPQLAGESAGVFVCARHTSKRGSGGQVRPRRAY